MFNKIKFFLLSFLLVSISISIWNIDWYLEQYQPKNSNVPSFEDYKNSDEEYKSYSWWKIWDWNKMNKREVELRATHIKLIGIEYSKNKIPYYWECFKENLCSVAPYISALFISFILIFPIIVFRLILYFIIAPIAQRGRNIKLFKGTVSSDSILIKKTEDKNLTVEIPSMETLIVIDEKYVSGFKDNKKLKKGMKWLFSWAYPIMSFFNGLRTMSKYKNLSSDVISIDITSDDPDEYFVEIDLKDCKSAFIIPSNIKAYSPTLKLKCTWRLFSIASLLLMQVRYYTLSGTGKLVLSARGGATIKSLKTKEEQRRKMESLIFSDSSLEINITRTENWYNYTFADSKLFDLYLKGNGDFLIVNAPSKKGILNFSSDSILNVIGKFFGF